MPPSSSVPKTASAGRAYPRPSTSRHEIASGGWPLPPMPYRRGPTPFSLREERRTRLPTGLGPAHPGPPGRHRRRHGHVRWRVDAILTKQVVVSVALPNFPETGRPVLPSALRPTVRRTRPISEGVREEFDARRGLCRPSANGATAPRALRQQLTPPGEASVRGGSRGKNNHPAAKRRGVIPLSEKKCV